jgi:hypothetical protein
MTRRKVRSRSRLRAATLGAAFFLAFVEPGAAQSVADLPLAGGGSERVVLTSPGQPAALLVMFAGGDGAVGIADDGTINRLAGNFLLRTEPLWLEQGFAVEILGAPNNASLKGQPYTEAYVDAVSRAVAYAGGKIHVPIWLVGTSAGTPRAAAAAAHLGDSVAGLVLTSSITRGDGTVFDTNLAAITVPVLAVANQGDSCPVTPPGDASKIAAALIRSPRKEVVYVQSDQVRSAACEAFAPHGFFGIEAAVIQRIADWIRATSARARG